MSISLVSSRSLSLFIAIFQEFSLSSVPVHVCSSIYGSTWYQHITTKPRSTRTTGVPGDHRPLCRLKTSISGSRNSNGRVCVTNLGTKFYGCMDGYGTPMCKAIFNLTSATKRSQISTWSAKILMPHNGLGMTLWAQQSDVRLQVLLHIFVWFSDVFGHIRVEGLIA